MFDGLFVCLLACLFAGSFVCLSSLGSLVVWLFVRVLGMLAACLVALLWIRLLCVRACV